jgi:hypothetical protein
MVGARVRVGLAIGMAVALALGGCGGDDSSTDAASTTSSSTTSTTSGTSTTGAGTARSSTTISAKPGSGLSVTGVAGIWEGHGRTLSVDDDGAFEIDYRTYRDCDSGDPEPCDHVEGNQLFAGGKAAGHLSSGSGPWLGTITDSNDETVFPLGVVTITKDPDQDLLHVEPGQAEEQTFCGDDVTGSPCGA